MDLSKFSDDNFSVKDWVNSVFRSQPDDSETYTTTLVARLQNYIQVVNKSLEEASQQTVANLPRVLRDVDTLKQETSFLCQQMKQVVNLYAYYLFFRISWYFSSLNADKL